MATAAARITTQKATDDLQEALGVGGDLSVSRSLGPSGWLGAGAMALCCATCLGGLGGLEGRGHPAYPVVVGQLPRITVRDRAGGHYRCAKNRPPQMFLPVF